MTEFVPKWQNPPPSALAGPRTKLDSVREELKANPGRWLLFKQNISPSIASQIRLGSGSWKPKHAYETTTRATSNGKADIYVRYVGIDLPTIDTPALVVTVTPSPVVAAGLSTPIKQKGRVPKTTATTGGWAVRRDAKKILARLRAGEAESVFLAEYQMDSSPFRQALKKSVKIGAGELALLFPRVKTAPKYNKQDAIHALLEAARFVSSSSLTTSAYDDFRDKHPREELPSNWTIIKMFGSWDAACTAAGLAASGRKPRKQISKREVDGALRLYFTVVPQKNWSALHLRDWLKARPEHPSFSSLNTHVGAWSDLVKRGLTVS